MQRLVNQLQIDFQRFRRVAEPPPAGRSDGVPHPATLTRQCWSSAPRVASAVHLSSIFPLCDFTNSIDRPSTCQERATRFFSGLPARGQAGWSLRAQCAGLRAIFFLINPKHERGIFFSHVPVAPLALPLPSLVPPSTSIGIPNPSSPSSRPRSASSARCAAPSSNSAAGTAAARRYRHLVQPHEPLPHPRLPRPRTDRATLEAILPRLLPRGVLFGHESESTGAVRAAPTRQSLRITSRGNLETRSDPGLTLASTRLPPLAGCPPLLQPGDRRFNRPHGKAKRGDPVIQHGLAPRLRNSCQGRPGSARRECRSATAAGLPSSRASEAHSLHPIKILLASSLTANAEPSCGEVP
jgi:hypothetical protein